MVESFSFIHFMGAFVYFEVDQKIYPLCDLFSKRGTNAIHPLAQAPRGRGA